MRTRATLCIASLIICAGSMAFAQTMEQHPGYFALEDLDVFEPDKVAVDVDLRDAMIKVAAGASAQQDENLSRLLETVKRVRVKVGVPRSRDVESIRSTIEGAASQLEGLGWYRMVTVREDEELVYVMAREGDNVINGLTVMVHDGSDEVVLVNIAGEMDPELIAELMKHMDKLDDLDFDFG